MEILNIIKRKSIIKNAQVKLYPSSVIAKAFSDLGNYDETVYLDTLNDQLILACKLGKNDDLGGLVSLGADLEAKKGEPLFVAIKHLNVDTVDVLVTKLGVSRNGAWVYQGGDSPRFRDVASAFPPRQSSASQAIKRILDVSVNP